MEIEPTPRIPDSNPWIRVPFLGFRITLPGFWIPIPGFWIPLLGYIPDNTPWIPLLSWIPDSNPWIPDSTSGFQSLDCEFHFLDS